MSASAHTHAQPAVPGVARGPAIPKAGYLVEEIGDRLFWLTDGLYQMMFLVTGDGVVAVDAPPTLGHNILRAIGSVTPRPVTHAVYSHHHADHTGAMALYENATLYGQEEAARLLHAAGDPNRPAPGHVFTERLDVEVGGAQLELRYHGHVHSPGNTFIYAPAQRTLMLVDVVYPGWVPFATLAVAQDIPAWAAAPATVLGYPFDTFVGGHLTRLGTRADVQLHQDYLEDLRAACEEAIATFDVATVFAAVDPTDPWAVFRGYLDGVAAQAATAIAPAWIERLGGVDAFTDMNAWALIESLRLDAGHLGPFGIRP